jgi:Ca-activated chloride channel family protein
MKLTPDDPKLTAYALGELDATERAAVEAALARSPECRRAVDEIRALAGNLTTELAQDAAMAKASLTAEPWTRAGDLQSPSAMSSTPDGDYKSPALAAGADAAGEGKVIFLPWRHWRTLGMAAAAALVVGFFVTKAWLPKPTEQMAKEDMSLPAARAKAVTNSTNQVAQTATLTSLESATNAIVTLRRTNGSSGVVTVNFATGNGTAVAGVDYIAQNGTLTFADGGRHTTFSVPIATTTPPGQNVAYRMVVPRTADLGYVITGVQNEYGVTTHQGWGFRPDTTTTAAYPRYVENPFTLVASEPLSTFSTDVDTASYANVRRLLNQNQLPPRDAVRIEELLNYFTYDYAPPTGEHPFAAHVEVAGCPWAPEHRLVRVGLKGRELKADKRPPSNFVFLIDVSGSMSPVTRLPLIKQSLRQLVKRMTENDRVAMVVYASSSGTVLESTSAVNKEVILAAIDRLEAGGSTNGGEGIQRAYDLAVANFIKGGVNRVLLCTDGDFNVGITDRGQLLKLIEEKAKSGVFLTTLGVGDDNFKDATLQQLADKGNGNYHYLDSVEEGHKVLVEQMNATLVTIAKDVKIQIEFNPAQASAYRLIGYEKRILAKQDFNNDAKDAGEIGAGHTVTALYEIVPPGVQLRGEVDPLKYQTSNQPAAKDSVIPARPKTVGAAEWEEFTKARTQLEASIAELSKTYVPAHPKMQILYKQREALEKRLRDLNPVSKELLTLKLRYKAPDGDKSTLMEIPVTDSGAKLARASADFKFASAVASFGMVLKDSPFKGTATLDSALELAQEGKGDDTHGYRAEFINLLAKAKALKK